MRTVENEEKKRSGGKGDNFFLIVTDYLKRNEEVSRNDDRELKKKTGCMSCF